MEYPFLVPFTLRRRETFCLHGANRSAGLQPGLRPLSHDQSIYSEHTSTNLLVVLPHITNMKIIKSFKFVSTGMAIGCLSLCIGLAAESGGSRAVRASSIHGASVSFQGGGSAGTIEDVILDPETGCARFAIIRMEGRTVAAPYRILRSSGPSAYIATVERERLMNAPAVDVTRIEEFSSPEFSQRVYGYYNLGSEEHVNIKSGREGIERRERDVRGERGRNLQDQRERGTTEAAQSPSPVGEKGKKRKNASPTPSASASPSASPTLTPRVNASATPRALRSGTGQSTEALPSPSAVRPSATPMESASPSATRQMPQNIATPAPQR